MRCERCSCGVRYPHFSVFGVRKTFLRGAKSAFFRFRGAQVPLAGCDIRIFPSSGCASASCGVRNPHFPEFGVRKCFLRGAKSAFSRVRGAQEPHRINSNTFSNEKIAALAIFPITNQKSSRIGSFYTKVEVNLNASSHGILDRHAVRLHHDHWSNRRVYLLPRKEETDLMALSAISAR